MEIYKLVIKNGNSYRIGLKNYQKSEALLRKKELQNKGIRVQVMTESQAFGLTK